MIFEFAHGGDLKKYIENFEYTHGHSKGLENPTLSSIALGIAQGLKHIHNKDVIHRDLKPQNIVLEPAGAPSPPVPKIADFGAARDEETELTMTLIGTPYYISPEVTRGAIRLIS